MNRWSLAAVLAGLVVWVSLVAVLVSGDLPSWLRGLVSEEDSPQWPSTVGAVRRPGDTFKDCEFCPEMVVIPAGSFRMGNIQSGDYHTMGNIQSGDYHTMGNIQSGDYHTVENIQSGDYHMHPAKTYILGGSGTKVTPNELPVHTVRIGRAFAIGKYEVTFEEYDRFAQATRRPKPDDTGWGRGWPWGSRPVIRVSWHNAKAYAAWLAQQTGKHYRLPTEAEWEYAARAGTQTVYWWGNKPNQDGKDWADCDGCLSHFLTRIKLIIVRTLSFPVSPFPANEFGLYGTAGSVDEWVEDCWNENYEGAPSDGSAWETGECSERRVRVIRGGRSAARSWRGENIPHPEANFWYKRVGFRLAQDL